MSSALVEHVGPDQAGVDQVVTAREELLRLVRVVVAVPLIDLHELLDAENDQVGELDHRVLAGVDRITELNHVLDPLRSDDLEPPKSRHRRDFSFELLLLVDDNHATRGPTKANFDMLIDGGRQVVEREKIRDTAVETGVFGSVSRSVEADLIQSDDVRMVGTRSDQAQKVECELATAISIVPSENPASVGAEQVI